MQQLIESGAGVKLMINGSVVGFATGISFTRSTGTKYIYGIDSPIAQEVIKTTFSVQGTLTGLRLRDSGGLDGYGIMDESSIAAFFNFRYATIEIVNRTTNKTIGLIQNCVFDNDSWSMQAKQIITFNANFKGTFITNEVSG